MFQQLSQLSRYSMQTENPEIPISLIEVGSRFRKDYGDIDQLCFSITKNGLITPIAVGVAEKMLIPRETDLPYMLLAGGRRLTALKKLGKTDVTARIYDVPLTELDFRSIELAENFDRKNMEYGEEVALLKQIHTLQTSIHGQKISKAPDAPGWSQADTARLTNKSGATVTKDLQLAEAIARFPELQLDSCKNKAEAFKRLKNVGTMCSNAIGAKAYVKSVGGSDQTFAKLSSSYIIADCLDIYSKIPDASLDFIEIDPPYAIDLANVKKDNDCIGYNEIPVDIYADFMLKVFRESFRTLKEGGWLVCWFAADPWFQPVADLLRGEGFKMNLLPGMWVKNIGQTAQPETFLGNAYEQFFYARKGKSVLKKPGRLNTFIFNPVSHTQKYHPTQRPFDLMQEIFKTFTLPGNSAFIPFLGSGVSIMAAHSLNVKAIGADLNSPYKDAYILELKHFMEKL